MCMAVSTSGRELIGFVIRIDGIIIICLVAPYAGVRCIVVVAVVAVCTLIGNGEVCPF